MGLYNKAVNGLINWLMKEPPPAETPPYDFNRLKYEIRPCDVLLIEGQSRVSQTVRTFTQSPWTHAAFYIGRIIDFDRGNLVSQPPSKLQSFLFLPNPIDYVVFPYPLSIPPMPSGAIPY